MFRTATRFAVSISQKRACEFTEQSLRSVQMKFAVSLLASCLIFTISTPVQSAALTLAVAAPLQTLVQKSTPKGVIGLVVDNETNQITRIYPESDLNRLGIKSGDYLVSVNGDKTLRGDRLRGALDGPIDWPVWIQFEIAGGATVAYAVERKETKFFVQYRDEQLVAVENRGYYERYLDQNISD
jgi:hypothetical protein